MSDFINVDNQIVSITIIKPDTEILSIAEETAISMSIIDVGIQGIRGASGKFEDLTILEKQELLGDIISTNYTNLFNSVLLS